MNALRPQHGSVRQYVRTLVHHQTRLHRGSGRASGRIAMAPCRCQQEVRSAPLAALLLRGGLICRSTETLGWCGSTGIHSGREGARRDSYCRDGQ